jgi:nitrite reductase (NADH) large subunit
LRARRIGSARKPPRKMPTWLHILALWPLPVLILFHVLASYAF